MFSTHETHWVPGAQAGQAKTEWDSSSRNFHLEFRRKLSTKVGFPLWECVRGIMVRGCSTARKNDLVRDIFVAIANFVFGD